MSFNIGLIGTGFMGKCHALAWNAVGPTFGVPRPRLLHLAESSSELAEAKASEFGFERASGDWHRLVEDPDVDIVSITTPNHLHAEIAIAALRAGKHVWCEKPMATSEADAAKMLEAAREFGKLAVLGYNYIQSPAIRKIGDLLKSQVVGVVNHVRVEMDEDFMADQQAAFQWKHSSASGYGALDDFAVHPLSLLSRLIGNVDSVVTDMSRLGTTRSVAQSSPRPIETYDVASVLVRFASGASGLIAVNRGAWGRKNRLQVQIFGSLGTIVFDQERFNEFQIFLRNDVEGISGFRTVLTGNEHQPYREFVPAPGHGLGFNDIKVIEAHEIIRKLSGEAANFIDFEQGLQIERTMHAMAKSFENGAWVKVLCESPRVS